MSNERNVCLNNYMLNYQIKGFSIPLQKNYSFVKGFNFFAKSIKNRPDSLCENNNNNELHVCAYYILNY